MKARQPVITFDHVIKRYPLYHHLGSGLKSLLLHPRRALALWRHRAHTALDDVSFSVHSGESVALMGRNGAGKSTTLSLVAGVLQPSAGRVTVRGRVASLLELGAGFHPELTGRENIRLNATLLGMSQADIRQAMPRIIEFAGLGDFINEPVRIYSSGMQARLGFAVITEASPDILLVDEVLAVGDIAFRQRCLDVLTAFRKKGVTLLFVSHNPTDIRQFCDRVLWFENCRLVADGTPKKLLPRYQTAMKPARK